MFRILMIASAFAMVAMGAVEYLKVPNSASLNARPSVENQTEIEQARPANLAGVVRIPRAANGHYEAEFKLNNARVRAIIDTGASVIAINQSTARRAGVRLTSADFTHQVNTANGKTKAAKAMLSQVQIGSIRLYDVPAMVLEDKALNQVLIGMSFMNRLRGFEYKSNNLVLKN